MRRSFHVALAAWLFAGVAGAQLSQTYKDWENGPAQYLLTKAEKKAYDALKSDADAQAFIDLFWAKRNPNLDSSVNQFKLEFDAKVAAADKQFSYAKTKGSLTDRGRVLILLGPPSRVSGSARQAQAGRMENPGDEEKGATETWTYLKAKLPADVKQDQVSFVFVESRPGLGDYALERGGDRSSAFALKLLADEPDRLLLHPKLTEVPKLGLLSGSKAASAQQLAVFTAATRPWPQGAKVFTATGFQSATIHPLWIHVELPDAVPAASQAIGRVLKAAGDELGSFVVPATPMTVPGGRAYELSLPLQSGTWKVDLALFDAGGPVAVTTLDASTEAVPAEGAYLSPFYWGVDVRQEAQAHLGDAFNVGGWHVLPRLGDHYETKEQLSYFCYVERPTLDDQGKPHVDVSLALFQGEKKLTERPFEPTNLSEVSGDTWMFGSGLPMSIFRKSGDYRLEVTLRDDKSGLTRTAKIPISVAVEAPAAPAATAPPPHK